MKYSFLISLVLLATSSFAQRGDSARNAIGIYGETNGMFSGNNVSTMFTAGIQYNRWNRKHFSYKLMLGMGNYSERDHGGSSSISNDTLVIKRNVLDIKLGVIGAGVKYDRQFYRKLYFFAGLELRAGYGSGTQDTSIVREYNKPLSTPVGGPGLMGLYSTEQTKDGVTASMFYAGFTPSFGLELRLRRFTIGTEFLNYVSYRSVSLPHHSTDATVDFDSGNLTQRVFLHYRF